MADAPQGRADESEAVRYDRQLAELLQELRVAGIGVQMLFGFLLALPFSHGFPTVTHTQREIYVATLLLAALATALLVGPVAYHRLVFQRHQKGHLIRAAHVMALTGLATVALAVCGAVLLVVSYVDRGLPVVVFPILVACVFAAMWFVVPVIRRERADAAAARGNLSEPGGPRESAGESS